MRRWRRSRGRRGGGVRRRHDEGRVAVGSTMRPPRSVSNRWASRKPWSAVNVEAGPSGCGGCRPTGRPRRRAGPPRPAGCPQRLGPSDQRLDRAAGRDAGPALLGDRQRPGDQGDHQGGGDADEQAAQSPGGPAGRFTMASRAAPGVDVLPLDGETGRPSSSAPRSPPPAVTRGRARRRRPASFHARAAAARWCSWSSTGGRRRSSRPGDASG